MNIIIPFAAGRRSKHRKHYNTPHADHMLFNCFRQSLISTPVWMKPVPSKFSSIEPLNMVHILHIIQSSIEHASFLCMHVLIRKFRIWWNFYFSIFCCCSRLWIIQLNSVSSSIILTIQYVHFSVQSGNKKKTHTHTHSHLNPQYSLANHLETLDNCRLCPIIRILVAQHEYHRSEMLGKAIFLTIFMAFE